MRLTIELPERTLLLAAAALLLVWTLLKLRRIRTVRCDTSRRNLKVRQLPSFTPVAAADAASKRRTLLLVPRPHALLGRSPACRQHA